MSPSYQTGLFSVKLTGKTPGDPYGQSEPLYWRQRSFCFILHFIVEKHTPNQFFGRICLLYVKKPISYSTLKSLNLPLDTLIHFSGTHTTHPQHYFSLFFPQTMSFRYHIFFESHNWFISFTQHFFEKTELLIRC